MGNDAAILIPETDLNNGLDLPETPLELLVWHFASETVKKHDDAEFKQHLSRYKGKKYTKLIHLKNPESLTDYDHIIPRVYVRNPTSEINFQETGYLLQHSELAEFYREEKDCRVEFTPASSMIQVDCEFKDFLEVIRKIPDDVSLKYRHSINGDENIMRHKLLFKSGKEGQMSALRFVLDYLKQKD